MSIIRLLTSGRHKGLIFLKSEIESIAQNTADFADDQIPLVLGNHQKKLLIMGCIPKSALRTYREGDKISIGFDKSAIYMSDENMDLLRDIRYNKLSSHLADGVVKHIGLVKRAAAPENNTQDVQTGTFLACDNLFDTPSKGILNAFRSLFDNRGERRAGTILDSPTATPDLMSMQAKVDQVVVDVAKLVDAMRQKQEQSTTYDNTANLAAIKGSHLDLVPKSKEKPSGGIKTETTIEPSPEGE